MIFSVNLCAFFVHLCATDFFFAPVFRGRAHETSNSFRFNPPIFPFLASSMKVFQSLSKAGINVFFLCLIATVFLAWLFPEFGSANSMVPLRQITGYGVSVIFFFYGAQLNFKNLVEGLRNWRLHLTVQSTTFILFPLVAGVIVYFFGNVNEPLWLGFFYLSALPSTVSSSVVMVSIAGGNVAAAIFNASLSSIIGIFMTPVWMSFYDVQAGSDVELSDAIGKLSVQVLLPVIIGMLFHSRIGAWVLKYKTWLRFTDQFIILLIVFTAFAESFLGKMFEDFSAQQIVLLSIAMLLFFLAMAATMFLVSSSLRFPLGDRITVIFCGSKKSLVQGAVMGRVLFPDPVVFGVILLPLMLYHALQLMAGSMLAQIISRKSLS
jgi:sodium/bile acid cotransporter 7